MTPKEQKIFDRLAEVAASTRKSAQRWLPESGDSSYTFGRMFLNAVISGTREAIAAELYGQFAEFVESDERTFTDCVVAVRNRERDAILSGHHRPNSTSIIDDAVNCLRYEVACRFVRDLDSFIAILIEKENI